MKSGISLGLVLDDTRPTNALFDDNFTIDSNYHASSLAALNNDALRKLGTENVHFDLIRTLAADLITRDAEIVSLRRCLEEMGRIFKDHLCNEHGLDRLSADRMVHEWTRAGKVQEEDIITDALDLAIDSEIKGSCGSIPSTLGTTVVLQDSHSQSRDEKPPVRPKGVLAMFGGRGGNKVKRTNGVPEKLDVQTPQKPKGESKVGFKEQRNGVKSPVATQKSLPRIHTLEMNAIVDTEDLPPPLVSPINVQDRYPDTPVDVYGFIIDSSRISNFIDKQKSLPPTPMKRSDTPITSSSSVKSLSQDEDGDHDTSDGDSMTWASYLKIDTSSLGSLSWLPIASPYAQSQHSLDIVDDCNDVEDGDAIKLLQQQMTNDFENMQKARIGPWERFLSHDRIQSDSVSTKSYMSNLLLRRNLPPTPHQTPPTELPFSQTSSLNPTLRRERTRLVLQGIPMCLRAQIYTSVALEYIQPAPDEYSILIQNSFHVDPQLISEIEDDIPRTLPNNVFFRPSSPSTTSKGRIALRELLLAFLSRRPEIGYCQGMNLIAAFLLLCLPSTESAFWVFVYLIEHVLADVYFDATLRGASIEIGVLRSYIDELIPRLGKKFDECGVEGRESAPYNWFLTAYASALGVEGVYRVWDVLLGLPLKEGGGSGFMIRFGLALCKAFEEDMLNLEGGFEIRGFMDKMGVGGVGTTISNGNNKGKEKKKDKDVKEGVSIDGLIRACWKLGNVVKDEEVRKRRKYFALKVDE